MTVINFWGTFCSPCIAEMPDLADFEKALPDNVQLITVCVDAEGNEETAKEILNYAGYEGITLVDGDDSFKEMLKVAQAIPITIFIGPDGEQIGEGILGMQQDLEGAYLSAINSALKELVKAEISLDKEPRVGAHLPLLALGVLFIAVGLLRREHIEVLQKAVMICLECIGIG